MQNWIELLDQPATAEVHHFKKMPIESYPSLLHALADMHDADTEGWAYICNVTAADGTVYRPKSHD